ncbi:MAG: type II toxin-antitoxin system RelE/ParE family toxin [Methylococcales bacterium]
MVIWTEQAIVDLRSIHDFIAHDSRTYAKKVTQEIRKKTDILESLPCLGRVVSELGDDNIREISQYSYRIIYQIANQQIFILTIAHKRQDLNNLSGNRSEQ